METEECWGGSQWYHWWEMGLLGLLSCSSPSPLPTLPFTFHLLPFWSSPERCHGLSGRRQRGRKGAKPLIPRAIFACLTVRLDSSHTPVVCRALRCFAQLQLHQAQLSRGAHWAPPRFCLPVCGKRGALSQPCSLTAFPSHSRVIKKEPHAALNPQALPPSPPVFSRHCSTSVSSGTSGMNILADTFTPAGPDWITGKEEELRCISWARLSLHGLVEARLRYHGSSWKTASLLPVPLNE